MIIDFISREPWGAVSGPHAPAGANNSLALAALRAGLDPVTMGKIEVLCLRDGIDIIRFMTIAVDAYALMLPCLFDAQLLDGTVTP
jgi:hypothetical protein